MDPNSCQEAEPEGGAEGRSRRAEPEGGAGGRSRGAEPKGGAEGRSRRAEPRGGAGGRSRGAEPEGGAEGRSRRSTETIHTGAGVGHVCPELGLLFNSDRQCLGPWGECGGAWWTFTHSFIEFTGDG